MKRCPFCGSDDLEVDILEECVELKWSVWCDGCDAEGPLNPTRDGAIEAWDNRINIEESSH